MGFDASCLNTKLGKRPFGHSSLYDYHLNRRLQVQRSGVDPPAFSLTPEECAELRQEALQFYYRYLSFFYLGNYAGVQRDTERNLEVFDFVRTYAADEDDRFGDS